MTCKTALIFVVICLGERGHANMRVLAASDLIVIAGTYSWYLDFDGVYQKVTETQDSDINEARLPKYYFRRLSALKKPKLKRI